MNISKSDPAQSVEQDRVDSTRGVPQTILDGKLAHLKLAPTPIAFLTTALKHILLH